VEIQGFADYKTRGPVILKPSDTAELIEKLEDSQMQLGSMATNRCVVGWPSKHYRLLHTLWNSNSSQKQSACQSTADILPCIVQQVQCPVQRSGARLDCEAEHGV
jgi:hypothetical protein